MTVHPLIQPHYGTHRGETHRPRWAVVAILAAITSLALIVVRRLRTRLYHPVTPLTFEDELGG